MSRARAFAGFWWDFVVGDDWRVGAGLAFALALTALLAHDDVPAWWLMPIAVALLLAGSLRRATRRSDRTGADRCKDADRGQVPRTPIPTEPTPRLGSSETSTPGRTGS